MVIKNLENKIKLVMIITGLVVVACVIISISSIVAATNMVVDSQKKIYVLDGNVPILVNAYYDGRNIGCRSTVTRGDVSSLLFYVGT